MTIQAGSRLGPYEIVAPIGAGGMGEVWKARDTRIDRDVALKVLPHHFVSDPERLARFQQEARTAGSLNHPNLVTLFDVGTEEGVPYLAMELLEGESLRDKLEENHPLPYRKALDYARQVATGLAAAHDKGIVHRDLKPENVFVTRDGRVKILDFGLAKLTAPASDINADSVTQQQVTNPGAVMGTAGYMSPEQVRGTAVDHRSDIFALGIILYELFSGRRAFRRDSSIETMNAILKEDPPELSTRERPVSPAVERIIRRCLEKSRDERFQSARDLAFAVDAVSDTTSFGSHPPLPKPRPGRGVIAAMAVVAVLAITFVAGRATKKEPSQPHLRQLTFRSGTVRSARFTPDGQTVVYGAAWEGAPLRLFQYRLDGAAAVPLEYPDGDLLSISPKGELAISLSRKFVYWMSSGTLAKAPLLGNAYRKVADEVSWAEWNPAGDSLVVVRRVKGEDRLEYPLGTVLYRTTGYIAYPRFSSDGERIAFLDHPVFGDNRGDVAVLTVRDRQKKILARGWSSLEGLSWSADGREVWFSGAKVNGNFAMFATNGSGEPRCVWTAPGQLILLDIDRAGRALVASGSITSAMHALERGAVREATLANQGFTILNAISNDGRSALAVSYSGDASLYGDALLLPLRGGGGAKLGEGLPLQFSPDGKWAIDLIASAPPKLVLYRTDAEETKAIDTASLNVANAAFLGDERRIVVTSPEGQSSKTVLIDVETGKKTVLPIESTSGNPVIERLLPSPDGTKIAIRVLPHDGPASTNIYAITGQLLGKLPAEYASVNWTTDSRALYVYRQEDLPLRIEKFDVATGAFTPWREIAPVDVSAAMSAPSVQMNPDGDSYAYTLLKMQTDLYVVEGLR